MLILRILLRYIKHFNQMYCQDFQIKIKYKPLRVLIKNINNRLINPDLLFDSILGCIKLVHTKSFSIHSYMFYYRLVEQDLNYLIKLTCYTDTLNLFQKFKINNNKASFILNNFIKDEYSFLSLPFANIIDHLFNSKEKFKFIMEYKSLLINKLTN